MDGMRTIDQMLKRIARMRFSMILVMLLSVQAAGSGFCWAGDTFRIEKKILDTLRDPSVAAALPNLSCKSDTPWQVFLIDNFEQTVRIIPEITTSHGEMMEKMLRSGRDDIDIIVLDTALSKGLAMVLQRLLAGACVDAVVSSTPGSNYSYAQVGSLLPGPVALTPENILRYRDRLRTLLREIAFKGFPSVAWLERADVNSIKLKNDALKFVFIEALGRFHIPVFLPYGNLDTRHNGEIKAVNLLSLAPNARIYSALDQSGDRIPGYPYSPLGREDGQAVYNIVECPHPRDPYKAQIDINNDGVADYEFFRNGPLAYINETGHLSFAPPPISRQEFDRFSSNLSRTAGCGLEDSVVVTRDQFLALKQVCPETFTIVLRTPYIWLNAFPGRPFFEFEAACRNRGQITGTSVIPPNKVKEWLPYRLPFPAENR